MSFFLLSLIAPAMWALSNHFDKFIVSRYFKEASLGGMMIFSALIAVAILPVAFVLQDEGLAVGSATALALIANGCLYLLAVQLYLMALRISDASSSVPILQLTPVVSFVLAYLILGETLSSEQMLGGVLIVLGAVAISFEISEGGPLKCRGDVFGLMFLSSFLFALQYILFKVYAMHADFWSTIFWESIGFVCFGIFLLVFVQSYRRDFLAVFVRQGWATTINLAGEVFNITGKIAFNYVSLLIPITLAWVGVGFQPLFVLLYSVILTAFFPHIGAEKVMGRHLIQKAVSVGVMLVGAYILNA